MKIQNNMKLKNLNRKMRFHFLVDGFELSLIIVSNTLIKTIFTITSENTAPNLISPSFTCAIILLINVKIISLHRFLILGNNFIINKFGKLNVSCKYGRETPKI